MSSVTDEVRRNRTGDRRISKLKRDRESSILRILDAATIEFAQNGFGGARVDNIAARAQINKQMLYHYFGNKEDLYLAVLEAGYAKIRTHERELDLAVSDPVEAVRKLVRYTFHYFQENPEFIRLLNDENLYDAQHIKNSERIKSMHSPLIAEISQILKRGHEAGVMRKGVDPAQLYITIAALSYFYLSNAATLSVIFDRDLKAPEAQKQRIAHIEDVVIGYLRAPVEERQKLDASAK